MLYSKNHQIILYLQNQCTPLYAASEGGFTEIVKLLIAADANVDCICEVSHYNSKNHAVRVFHS